MSDQSRLLRLFRLVETLGAGRPQNATILAEICDVSRRTVFRDIAALQEAGVHVHYDVEKQGYFLNRPCFLRPTDLTLEETLALIVMGVEIGKSQSALMFCNHIHTAAMKLACNLPERLRESVNHVTESVHIQIGSNTTTEQERQIFDTLKSALSDRHSVRMTYDSLFDRAQIGTKLSPYRLLFTRREWYIIGRSSLHRAVRTFKVRRILSALKLEDRYIIPPRFSIDRYLGNAWHLIRDKSNRSHVVIRFRPLVARNVAEVHWHKTQQAVWMADGSLEMHFDVDGFSELSWWLLGYGDQAEVISPPELRQMLAQRLKGLVQIYEPELSLTPTPKPANRKKTGSKKPH